jgi:hypothetical protein
MSSYARRDLFGGAITAMMPVQLIDASDLRQIPDTQEAFLYRNSSVTIIIEILERVEPTHFEDAVRFHFQSLADDNSAEFSQVQSVNVIPNDRGDDTPFPIVLTGLQLVRKFNRTHLDQVRILMGLFRVQAKHIDLVVTCNVPISSEDGGAVGDEGWSAANADFVSLIGSLKIVDFGLFA